MPKAESETELSDLHNDSEEAPSTPPKAKPKHATRVSRTKTVRTLQPQESKGELLSEAQIQSQLARESQTFTVILVAFQVMIIILYAVWLDYPTNGTPDPVTGFPGTNYNYVRDVNVMIFFGFGFLMTFLRRYGYSAIGYTLVVSAMVVQWSVLLQGFFETIAFADNTFTTYSFGINQLVNGLFCAAAVMISFGAILGKVSPTQMLILGFIEAMFYWLNIYICLFKLKAIDVGGGMVIHTFGAYYGLAITWFLTSKLSRTHKDNTSSYNSDLFSFAGTIFLWIMWPSFNAAVAVPGFGADRAIINTFLSLGSSTFSAFIFSRLGNSKFEVVHIQNSTLAGGVAMGVAANLYVTPAGAVACGFVVGGISVMGYRFVTPYLSNKFNLQDICGVHNLHGMPGVCSCIIGIFVTLSAKHNQAKYFGGYDDYFPRGDKQAGYQTAGLVVTLAMAIVSGICTGYILRAAWKINQMSKSDVFNDRAFWNLPSDYDQIIDPPESDKE